MSDPLVKLLKRRRHRQLQKTLLASQSSLTTKPESTSHDQAKPQLTVVSPVLTDARLSDTKLSDTAHSDSALSDSELSDSEHQRDPDDS